MMFASIAGAASVVFVAALLAPSVTLAEPAPVGTEDPAAVIAADAPASVGDCEDLVTAGSCSIAYADIGTDGYTDVPLPSSITRFTILAYGGQGGGSGDGSGRGGPGGLVVAVYERPSDADGVRVWIGEQGRQGSSTTRGFSSGGGGGTTDGGNDGYSGGGSTAVALTSGGSEAQLLVVAGGGGGASPNGDEGGAASGGSGGDPPGPGTIGTTPASDGNGQPGQGGGAGAPNGATGSDADGDYLISSGGGGGGGGYPHGGSAGESGSAGQCKINGKCPPNAQGGAGGGGGGGDSHVESPGLVDHAFASGSSGDGSVMLIVGDQLDRAECIDSSDPRSYTVPADVASIAFIIAGGGGTRGHNDDDMEGSGAVVTGVLDVTGMTEFGYWVGCSGYEHSGRGWSHPGSAGDASSGEAKDGGAGGAASMLMNTTAGASQPLVAAGGGGGSGGNASESVVPFASSLTGGRGGSGAGADGGAYTYNGGRGQGDDFDDGGVGGCAACRGTAAKPDPSGGDGSSDDTGGGGGGGGTGYPRGGAGGGTSSLVAGGGGGAGQSYWSPAVTSRVSAGPNGIRSQSGFIILVPIPVPPRTSLTVTKTVSGTGAAYARGPYTVAVACTLGGAPVAGDTFQIGIGPAAGHTLDAVPVGADCTVTETDSADASTPAPPQQLTLASGPATVALENVYATTSVAVELRSEFAPSSGPAPDDLPVGELFVGVSCELDGVPVTLGAPVVDGYLRFEGASTWSAGGAEATVEGVPVNSSCAIAHAAGPGSSTAFAHGGQSTGGASVEFTAAPDASANALSILDTYALAPLAVSNVAQGTNVPPSTEYVVWLGCTYLGGEVALDPDQGSFALTGGGTATVPNLPVGSDCMTTQLGGTSQAVHYVPAQSVPIHAGGATQTIVDVFGAGALTVVSQLDGPGTRWANAPTTVAVTCTADGVTDPIVDLEHDFGPQGGVLALDAPLDVGDHCSVEQVGAGGASAVSYSSGSDLTPSDDPVSVDIAAEGSSLTVRNRFEVAPIEVRSSHSGSASVHAGPTSVTIDHCTFNGERIELLPGVDRVVLAFARGGGVARSPVVVDGARCDVRQAASGGATSSQFEAVAGDPHVTLADGVNLTAHAGGASSTAVSIVNSFETGALTVGVALDGDAAWAANAGYRVEVHCTFDGRQASWIGPDGIGTLRFSADGEPLASWAASRLAELPAGTTCSAVEPDAGGATTVSYSPDAGSGSGVGSGSGAATVPAGASVSIGVTNTFEASTLTAATGLAGNAAGAHADTQFLLEQWCTFNGVRLGMPPSDPTRPTQFPLVGAGSRAFDLLPVGAECTVAETDALGTTKVLPAVRQTGQVVARGLELRFTNVFEVTSLTVRQVLTGAGAPTYGAGVDYWSTVSCWTGPDRRQSVRVPNDGVAELLPGNGFSLEWTLPAGAVCTLGESSWSVATMVAESPAVTLGLADPNLLEVTRVFELSTVEVAKRAPGGPAAASFAFDISCTWTKGRRSEAVPLNDGASDSLRLRADGEATRDVIGGADCAVTESDTAGATSTTVTVGADVVDGRSASMLIIAGDTARFAFLNAYPLPVTGVVLGLLPVLAGSLILAGVVVLSTRRRRRPPREASGAGVRRGNYD